jgi:hypothetical protein
VRKAVKWNSPFYGVEGQGWFLARTPETRTLDIHGGDELDREQLVKWIRQAAVIPGWNGGSPKNGGTAM